METPLKYLLEKMTINTALLEAVPPDKVVHDIYQQKDDKNADAFKEEKLRVGSEFWQIFIRHEADTGQSGNSIKKEF